MTLKAEVAEPAAKLSEALSATLRAVTECVVEDRTTARSMMFSSSRTLPGQSFC